jgi:hypothetical protein
MEYIIGGTIVITLAVFCYTGSVMACLMAIGVIVIGMLIIICIANVKINRHNKQCQDLRQRLIDEGHTCVKWRLRHVVDSDKKVSWCEQNPCRNINDDVIREIAT